MSSSRARTRLAAITAAIPLLVGAGPLVTPAAAAEDDPVRQAALVLTQGSYRIGPRAGFRGDVARGVEGNTAIVAFDAPTSATVSSVRIGVVRTEGFAFYNDFDSIDGFALYKDLDDDDRLDAAEHAAGKVSQNGYEVEVASGTLFVTVKGDAAKATGEDSYLLTVRPASSGVLAERDVTFTVPPNGISTTSGTFPAAALTLSTIKIDSKPPAAIPLANFQPVNRAPLATCPPGAAPGACGNDAYRVHRAVAAEPDEKIGFYNALNALTDDALLVVPSGTAPAPAVYDVGLISDSATDQTELSIGNGTGRDANVAGSKALNNQISDDVFAVQWDPLGNTVTATLTNIPPCDRNLQTCRDNAQMPYTPRGNDVTGPKPTSYAVTMPSINASTADLSAVTVSGSISGVDSSLHSFQQQSPIAQMAYPEEVTPVPGTNPVQYTPVPGHTGAEKRGSTVVPTTGTVALTSLVDVRHVVDGNIFPENSFIRAQARLVDALGNTAMPKTSNAVLKDTVAPSFVRVSLVDANADGVANKDETYRVEFNDPMDTTKITSTNVDTALALSDPSITGSCGSLADASTACPRWGRGATVTWSTDRRLAAVKLGNPCGSASTECTSLTRLPRTGDRINAASTVTDTNGNGLTNGTGFAISAPSVLAISATTKDTDGVGTPTFGTQRDGILDAIDVTFNGNLDPSTVSDVSTAQQFEVSLNGVTVKPTATLVSPGNTIRLSLHGLPGIDKQWHTGATPVVTLKAGTKVLRTSTVPVQDIAPFSLTSVDGAGPMPISVTTADTTKNGKIDRVFVTFPEAIEFSGEHAPNPCGWTVAGYADPNYKPHGPVTGVEACPGTAPTRNRPTAVPAGSTTPATIALELVELASAFDTHATPGVSFAAGNRIPNYPPNSSPPDCTKADDTTGQIPSTSTPTCSIKDTAKNELPSFTTFAVDGALPAIVERTTGDTNADGRLDVVNVKFSEQLDHVSVGNAFQLTNPAYTIMKVTVPTNTNVLLHLENTSVLGDTNATPTLTHAGGIRDLATPPNASASDTGVAVTDKAGPAIVGACASSPAGLNGNCPLDDAASDKLTLFFSEPLTTGSVAATDFAVEQPAGTAKAITGTPTFEDGDKRVVLTFAQGSIDSTKDAVVRLATGGTANGVQDKATTPNTSTQTSNVIAFAAPTVTLAITCPTPANAGYCMASQVNTGATGSGAVTRFRLATSARATTPPDAEFKSGVPAVYPETGVLPEGPLTLYLSGKDELGRLSPEVSGSITILKAPRILDVQYINPAVRGSNTFSPDDTVLDGDSLHIGADAYGTDADLWAANGAPTGGGCLADHMSIDLRAVTGSTRDAKRAPVSCDLSPPDAEQEFREMEFPVVKATRTTRYPVGTVLKISNSDPGWLVVDGSNGTVARRRFISVNARRSWMITDASVIKVPTSLVSAMPRLKDVGYRDGAILRGGPTGYYYVENGVKRPVSTTRLRAWRIPTTVAYRPTSTELKLMPSGSTIGGSSHAAGTWIKFSNGKIYQLVRNGSGRLVRRPLGSTAALRTLVPTSHVYAANSYDLKVPADSWIRGYRDGTILVWRNSAGQIVKTGVISRGSLRTFASNRVFNTLGFNASNGLKPNASAMPRVSGQAYRTGVAIDRYALGDVIIKVTNKAGASVTEEVPDATGLYGVGTLDPIPAGWDKTR